MPLFVIATLGYCYYCFRNLQLSVKRTLIPYTLGMLLLGISTCCTGSLFLQIFNFIGILFLLFCMLLEQFCNVKNWTITKYVFSLGNTVGGTISTISDFFSDMNCYRKTRTNARNKKLGFILLGIGISIPFLILIIALLCSADAVFADTISHLFDFDFHFGDIIRILCVLILVLLISYCTLRFLNKRTLTEEVSDLRNFEPLIANTILSLTSSLYLFFSFIQILYLFIGNMELPEGYTYAQYAREGFFQLLAVCILNVILVLFFLACFKENLLMKVLLTVISCCTYIMITSSALRMCMYIASYHLTFLRLFVLWTLLVLAILLGGILVLIYRPHFPMFRYMLVTVTSCYICFSFAHPDYWIAKYNLSPERAEHSLLETDTEYLCGLSTDAAPAIASCEEQKPWVSRYEAKVMSEYEDKGIRNFNFSIWYAFHVFQK